MRSLFSCLDKYRKDELVKYIASLFLHKDNSGHTLGVSALMSYALISKDGKKHLDISRLSKDVRSFYSLLADEDPQEYMFVDCVHTAERTYRVFPGYFAFIHSNLTRLFCVADYRKIPSKDLGEVYALLETSDIIAQRVGLRRYERGNDKANVRLQNFNDNKVYQDAITFNHREIAVICNHHGVKCEDARCFVIKPKASEYKRALNMEDPYSPTDKAPFYHTVNDEYIVLQPFSLLTCAYLRCLEILRKKLGEMTLENDYLEILMSDVHRNIKYGDKALLDKKTFGDIGCLVYQMDQDKVASICVSYQQNVEQKNEKEAIKYVKSRYAKKEILFVSVFNTLDIDMMIWGHPDSLLVSAEDFELMMRQDDMHLLNLYYYYQSRQTLTNVLGSQEIDMFAYYYSRGHTFYSDKTYTHYNFDCGLAFNMRCQYLQKKDYHLIDALGNKMMLVHSDDLPNGVPIYEPTGMKRHSIYVGELSYSRVVIFYDDSNKDDAYALREIAKSILVWLYAFEHRYDLQLLKEDTYTIYIGFNNDRPLVGDKGNNELKYEIPRQFFFHRPKDGTHEHNIFGFLIESLSHFKHLAIIDWKEKVNQMFQECRGQHLLLQSDVNDFWLIHDQYDTNYKVDEYESDLVLEDVANYLNRKGCEEKLDIKETEVVVKQTIIFLGEQLDKMLEEYATPLLVKRLMELHHATLFWQALTEVRFEKVNELYDYIGADYSEQLKLLNSYSETNNLTMCLIERIVSKNFNSGKKDLNIRAINKIYAYMHQLYIFGTYMDYVKSGIKSVEMSILPNGRLAIPQGKMDETQRYFHDLRNDEMYRRDAYRKVWDLEKESNIDYDDDEFQDAFLDEYGITLSEWADLLGTCVKYFYDNGLPIVDLSVEEFKQKILSKVVDENHFHGFMNSFCMSKDMIKEGIPVHETFMQRFNRIYQMSSRPWVCYEGRVLYSVKSLHHHQKVMLKRFEEGKMSEYSKKMKKLKGKVNEKKGGAFNDLLYELYTSSGINDLIVDKEVKIGPKERIKAEEALGDFDLILINRQQKTIVLIEAKDYLECRTVYEILSEEEKVQKALKMVLKRDKWSKNHVDAFRVVGQCVDSNYQVKTVFITAHRPAHLYFDEEGNGEIVKFFSALDVVEEPGIVFG